MQSRPVQNVPARCGPSLADYLVSAHPYLFRGTSATDHAHKAGHYIGHMRSLRFLNGGTDTVADDMKTTVDDAVRKYVVRRLLPSLARPAQLYDAVLPIVAASTQLSGHELDARTERICHRIYEKLHGLGYVNGVKGPDAAVTPSKTHLLQEIVAVEVRQWTTKRSLPAGMYNNPLV